MITTPRLLLRRFVEEDRAPLHALWSDARVMADLGPVKDRAASDATIERHRGYGGQGLGFLVVRRRDDDAFVGFCGLKPGNPATPIAGELEVGWMLAVDAWGQGYAQEAAAAGIAQGWAATRAARIVAITAARNLRSRRLMERLGLRHQAGEDFLYAGLEDDDPLRPTVIYAIDRP